MSTPRFHIILHQPEIPQNTGAIGRLCVNTEVALHLIHPLGFDVSDYYLRRAGLDYWEHLNPTHYKDWNDFQSRCPAQRLWFLSTKGSLRHTEPRYQYGDGFVLGCETKGLPLELISGHRHELIRIPMLGSLSRSLNLAQAAAISLFEALRQTEGW